jgi:hypothetical protein
MESKDTNPKDVVAAGKANLNCVPDSLVQYASMSFFEGMTKYGAFNWRHAGIKTSVYLNALSRHLTKYKSGEEFDPVTKVPHLASIIACAGIILDATLHGTCEDDRADDSAESVTLIDLVEHVQNHLRELHKDKKPVHYTKNRDRTELVPTPEPHFPIQPVIVDYQHGIGEWFTGTGGKPLQLQNNNGMIVIQDMTGHSYAAWINMVDWSNVSMWRYYG